MGFIELLAEAFEKIIFALGLMASAFVLYVIVYFAIDMIKPVIIESRVKRSKAVKNAVELLDKERRKVQQLRRENERLLDDVSFFQSQREFYKNLAFPEEIRNDKTDGKSIYSTPVEVKK